MKSLSLTTYPTISIQRTRTSLAKGHPPLDWRPAWSSCTHAPLLQSMRTRQTSTSPTETTAAEVSLDNECKIFSLFFAVGIKRNLPSLLLAPYQLKLGYTAFLAFLLLAAEHQHTSAVGPRKKHHKINLDL